MAVFSRRFTFLIIPHGAGNPKQINIHLSHIIFFLLAWTAVTGWGSYLSAQHVDYWRTKLSNQVLTLKVNYLVNELDQSNGFLDEVKQLEAQLRDMLQYKDEAALIQDLPRTQPKPATGGPSLGDQNDLTNLLKNAQHDISWNLLMEKTGALKSGAKTRIATYEDLSKYIDTRKKMFRATPRGWPCPGNVTSHYGKREDPFEAGEEFHGGVDIANGTGTGVRATADGRVLIAGWHSGYGNLVIIEHNFGYTTRYGHNSKIIVKPGEYVKRGQILSLMGSTGRASGPHCHYEVLRYSQRQNPFAYIKEQFPKFKTLTRAPSPAPLKKTEAL